MEILQIKYTCYFNILNIVKVLEYMYKFFYDSSSPPLQKCFLCPPHPYKYEPDYVTQFSGRKCGRIDRLWLVRWGY